MEKAIASGWKFAGNNSDATIEVLNRDDYFGNDPYILVDWHMDIENTEFSIADIIFNHDFAKALWGDEEDGTEFVEGIFEEQPKHRWKYYLQQAVISPDSVDYLYKAVFNDN